jgi:hypothetical protein
MLRKIAIGLAAAAIAVGGSTLSASAMHGGSGGGMHGGGMHGGGGHGGRVGGFGPRGGGGRYVMGDRYRHDHWRGRYGYRDYRPSYGGSCWRWTPEGRVWVCGGGYGPSYRYGYYRGGGWDRHRGGYGGGPHGGGGRHFR